MKKERTRKALSPAFDSTFFAKAFVCALAISTILLLTACTSNANSTSAPEPQGSSETADVHALEAKEAAMDSEEPPEYIETEDLAQYDGESFCIVLRNGKPAIEANVATLLASLENKYPDGNPSPDCGITAAMLIQDVFGEQASCMIESDPSLEDFRPGDEMQYSSDDIPDHNVVVIDKVYEKDANGNEVFVGVKIAEGNYLDDMQYHWGRVIEQSDVDTGSVVLKMRNYYYQ